MVADLNLWGLVGTCIAFRNALSMLFHFVHIPTKFHQNPSSGSGEEVENVKSLSQTDGQTDGRRTTDGAL